MKAREQKKGFLVYLNWYDAIGDLTIEEKGHLLDAMFAYNTTGTIPELRGAVNMAFKFIKPQFDASQLKYERICERNRKNIQNRWGDENKGEDDDKGKDDGKDKDKDKESIIPDDTTGIFGIPDDTTGIFRDSYLPKNIYEELAFKLWSQCNDYMTSQGITPTVLQRANAQDWAKEIRLMIESDNRTIEDVRAVIDWLPGCGFWEKNIQSAGSLRAKFERLMLDMSETRHLPGSSGKVNFDPTQKIN